MSIVRIITVGCDVCGAETDGDIATTQSEARSRARAQGWIRRPKQTNPYADADWRVLDICPACVHVEPTTTRGDAA
jgi:hypothetical protein